MTKRGKKKETFDHFPLHQKEKREKQHNNGEWKNPGMIVSRK